MSATIDFQPVDQGNAPIDFQPSDQTSSPPTQSTNSPDIGGSISKYLGYAQKAVPYVSAFASGNPMEGVSQYAAPKIADAMTQGANYLGGQVAEQGGKYFPNASPIIPAAAGFVTSIAANPLNYAGVSETGTPSAGSEGLDPAVAASREARTGVPARQFQALYKDPGAIFAGDGLKQAGQDIGTAKVAAGIDPGVTNNIASLTPDNIDRINPTKATKIDDIQTVLGQIQNGQPPTPQQAQNALDSVNSILSQPTVQNNQDVFRQWSAVKTHINNALADVAPDVKSANQAYAREKLGQNFEGMEPVNKSGKPSKLGLMARGTSAAAGGVIGALTGGHPVFGAGAGYEVGKYLDQAYHAPYVAGLQTALQGYLAQKAGPVLAGAGNAAAVPAASAIQSYIDRRNNQGGQ